MTRTLRLSLLAAASATACIAAASAASAQTYSRVVVFGDSLQDNGNLFRATNRTQPPSPPYFQGRFSNGPTFIEVLFPNQNPFGSTTGSVNNAFGGARSDIQQFPPSLPLQLQAYQAAGGRFAATDLVSVLGGANNILQAIPTAAANPATAQTVVGGVATAAAADIGNLTRSIAAAGAGTILVGNLPNIGATPQLAGPAAPLGSFASDTFNGALRAQLQAAAAAAPGTNIILADYNRASEFVRLNPQRFGFDNVTQTCLNAATGAVCATPDTFFFWDGVHPTAAAHRLLANVAADYLYYGRLSAPTAIQAETALEHRRRSFDAALDRSPVAPMLAARDSRISLTAEGGTSESDARGDVPDADIDTGLLRFTAEAGLTSDMHAGIAVAYTESDVDAGPTSFEATSISADLYGGVRRQAFFVDAAVGGSFEEYDDIRRLTSVAPAVHEADTTGYTLGAAVRGGLTFAFAGGSISPRVGLDYTRAQVEDYSEDGPMARHDIDEREVDAFAGQVSVRFDTRFGEGVDAWVEGGYRDYFSYDGEVSAGLVDNPAQRLVTGVDEPDEGVGLIDAGVMGRLGERWTIAASYRGRYGDGYESTTGRVTLGMNF